MSSLIVSAATLTASAHCCTPSPTTCGTPSRGRPLLYPQIKDCGRVQEVLLGAVLQRGQGASNRRLLVAIANAELCVDKQPDPVEQEHEYVHDEGEDDAECTHHDRLARLRPVQDLQRYSRVLFL